MGKKRTLIFLSTKEIRNKIEDFFTHICLIVFGFFLNLPVISMLGTALKGRNGALRDISLIPFPAKWDFSAFKVVLFYSNFPKNLYNSLCVAILVTSICITIASLTGYAISRFRGRVFKLYGTLLLILQIFPGVLLLLPLFILFSNMKLNNTLYCLVLAYTATNLAFSTWMMSGFFDSIPKELEEAGMVDGCTRFQTYYRIILPTSLPGIATVGIFTFINSWNEYTLASVLVQKQAMQTMTVGLQVFVQQFTSDWATLIAASSLAVFPTLIILFVAQKYLIQGMTAGAVKG
jgi:ABC-type glycerol-3-phosphate transport system permease component